MPTRAWSVRVTRGRSTRPLTLDVRHTELGDIMSEPKCPGCRAEGISNIVTLPSDQKYKDGSSMCHVSFCDKCGHVYGVATKTVYPNAEFTKSMLDYMKTVSDYLGERMNSTTSAVNQLKDMMIEIAKIHFSDKD